VDTLTKDVAGTPFEAATQPADAATDDSLDALTSEVTSTPAPVEAATQPVDGAVLGTTVDTLTKDVAGTPVEAPTQPVELTTPVDAQSGSSGDVSHPADTLLALATASDAPIEVPESATVAPSNTATAPQPTDLSGDVIALNDAAAPAEDTLFTGTQYTQYGITLSSDVGASTQNAVSPVEATSAEPNSAPAVAPPPDIVDSTHSTDHLAHAIL